MKLPNWAKISWWIILLAVVTFFIIKRFDSIINGSASPADIFIFLIWVSLLLVPLFQEISFFGVKLKKEMDGLKSYVREQMINIRSEIQNSVDVRTQISPRIYFNQPISDSRLPRLKKRFKEILNAQKTPSPVKTFKRAKIEEDTQFLFSVRHEIEKELRRIWKEFYPVEEGKPTKSFFQMVHSLSEIGIIKPEHTLVIRDVYNVCSPAIHGVQVSKSQVKFVRDIEPELMKSLKAIR